MACPFLTTIKLLTMAIIVVLTLIKLYHWNLLKKTFKASKKSDQKTTECISTSLSEPTSDVQQAQDNTNSLSYT